MIEKIYTDGLDEGIRCAMCTNTMKSDRGCDGGCVVNNAMYKRVMDVISKAIVQEVAKEYGNGWIPVEQKLPAPGDRVQVTYKGKMTGELFCDAMAYIAPDKSWHWDGVEGSKSHVDTEITAWKNPGAPYQKAPSRCDTCTHYIADEVPPICYLCCKGIEDNYERKGE